MADQDSRAGRRYASGDLLAFVDDIHAVEDEALRLAFTAPERENMPAIQVSRSEARWLEWLVRLIGACKAVEVGTLAGYSALRIARALPAHGRLWTLENEPHHAEVARRNLARAGMAERVQVCLGDALHTLSGLEVEGPFDVVFIDADKGRYPEYARWAHAHLRPGGLLVADNVYFFGGLLDPATPDAAAMRVFHEWVSAHFDSACVPTPDGMLVACRR